MHFNPLLTTSILALTSGAIAWTNQDAYDLYTRDVDGLYAREYAYNDESLYARDAEPEFLDWDVDTLHPRDAYELGLEAATQYLVAREAHPYPAQAVKGAAPAKPAAGPPKAAAPAKPSAAQQTKAKTELAATAKKQESTLMKAQKALKDTFSKERKLGMKPGFSRRDVQGEWEY